MGDFTKCRSSLGRDSAAGVAAPADELVEAARGPATMISGADSARGPAITDPDDGFFNRIRRSPREYSNSSRLCSDIVFRSRSICAISGSAADPLPLDFKGFLRFIRFVLELYEIPRGAGQDFGMFLMYRDVILNPNAPDACKVHPRFYRNHVSRGKLSFLAFRQSRVFMNLQPQTATCAVDKCLIELVGRQYPPGSCINVSAAR